jgi:hypothetical protein
MKRVCTLENHTVAVRDHDVGMKAKAPFMEVEPELQLHERVVKARGCKCPMLHSMDSPSHAVPGPHARIHNSACWPITPSTSTLRKKQLSPTSTGATP